MMGTHNATLFQVGSTCSFDYPRHNFHSVLSKLERRRLRITAVRDLVERPLERFTVDLQPLLNRSRWLVTGIDLDCNAERSFYAGAMKNVSIEDGVVAAAG
jgi:hypothetical protein